MNDLLINKGGNKKDSNHGPRLSKGRTTHCIARQHDRIGLQKVRADQKHVIETSYIHHLEIGR